MVAGGRVMTDVGKVYIDSKGAGRIYIPKRLMEKLNFESKERIILRIVGDVLEIRKLDSSPMLNGEEVSV